MRMPWIQIAQELIEVSAPELALDLDITEAEAGWGLLKLIRWVLARCPDGRPPSEGALFLHASAARHIALAAGYGGKPEAYVSALSRLRYAVLERTEGGVRFKGLDRYNAYWAKNNHAEWQKWRAFWAGTGPKPDGLGTETGRKPTGDRPELVPKPGETGRKPEVSGDGPAGNRVPDPDPDPDPDKYHHHQTSSTALAVVAPPVVVDFENCLKSLNAARVAAGLATEAKCRGFNAWCVDRGREGFTVRAIVAGYSEFVADPAIRSKTRSIAVFIRDCWQSRVKHLGPEPAAPTALELELEARLEPLRAVDGHAYAASQIREQLEPIAIIDGKLQLRTRDPFVHAWVADHYGEMFLRHGFELMPVPQLGNVGAAPNETSQGDAR